MSSYIGDVKVLNIVSLYTPLYAVSCKYTNLILFGSCPELIPSLKSHNDPAGFVNPLQFTRVIGKCMLFFFVDAS